MNGQDNKNGALDQLNTELLGVLEETGKEAKNIQSEEDKQEQVTETPKKPVKKKKKTSKTKKVLIGILIILLLVVMGAAGTFAWLRYDGEKQLKAQKELDMTAPNGAAVENNGDLVVYNGEKYCYNHNIITVLCLGIDKTEEEMEEIAEAGTSVYQGQADAVVLIAIDSETGKTTLINISRNSIADVDLYASNGKLIKTEKNKISLAYAQGLGPDGPEGNMMRSVSKLMYGIPIDSYVALNLSGIAKLNDAIGGVEVEVIEDLARLYPGNEEMQVLKVGNVVNLTGNMAYAYVRSRDLYFGDVNSNSDRMERQKQYIGAFANKVLQMTQEDITVPLTLFDIASDYMNTDLDAARVSYLTSLVSKIGIDEGNFLTVEGESKFDEEGYTEFYPDEAKLYEMILKVYYKKVQ